MKTKFWIVVNTNFPTSVSYKHKSMENAVKEAKRLASQIKGVEFVIMCSEVGFVVDEPVVEVKYVNAYDNPEDPEFIPF